MTDDPITRLEETIAHLAHTVDELSDIVARQEGEIGVLKRRVQVLLEREAGRELDSGGTVPVADQKPPHW
ncbi:SlyX family protein [Parasulfitobacter algicola]|uniref:SlyX family protein n=1 Tax=Parasulfitobacter algicola TaxID=2614809 RepID=A0ABX2IVP4_9RHOB|nr:SlyX family protein [Sulfitobacter algicola]NSX55105.1 SlyX family protein [Sulfitobacter algicola]